MKFCPVGAQIVPCRRTDIRLFLSDLEETWILTKDFQKSTYIPNFMKFCPVGAELFHADGRTDMTKLTVAFRKFESAVQAFEEMRGDEL
jgi:hypothetical protein